MQLSGQQGRNCGSVEPFAEQLQGCIAEMRGCGNSTGGSSSSSWEIRSGEFEAAFKSFRVPKLQATLLDLPADFFDSSDMDQADMSPVHGEPANEPPIGRGRRHFAALRISSSVPSEIERDEPAKSYGRFIDEEALCSNPIDSEIEDEDMSTSMAQFVTDGLDSNEGNGQGREADDDMMAFYRRTAYASQDDPRFAQPPKGFAPLRRPLAARPATKTLVTNDDAEFGSFDWASELELS